MFRAAMNNQVEVMVLIRAATSGSYGAPHPGYSQCELACHQDEANALSSSQFHAGNDDDAC